MELVSTQAEPMPAEDDLGSMPFREALAEFLETRKPFLHPRTIIDYRYCSKWLNQFFVAEKKGSVLPEHYVFPFRHTRTHKYHPDQPCNGFKKAWQLMLESAGIEKLRMYDLRHTAITRLCENPEASEETIESIAGHVTHEMKKRYSHVRTEARRAALARLVPQRLDPAHSPTNGNGNGQQKTGKPLTNENVLALVEAGLPAKVIVAKIERSPGAFDTSPETLKALKAGGVTDAVILAMVKA